MAPTDARLQPAISRNLRRDGDAAEADAAETDAVAAGVWPEAPRTGPRFWQPRHMMNLPAKSSATS
jgi:hypothetical protein